MKKIIVSGEIGWSVTAAAVRKELQAAGSDSIEVHFSSPGGSVFTGLEIANIFKDHKRTTGAMMTSRIIGLAASMGSYLALSEAFNEVIAESNSVLMIHNAAGAIAGDKNEMRKMVEVLDGVDNLLAQVYAQRSGKPVSEIKKLMDAESWFFADEIQKAGFVDRIIKTDDPMDKASAITQAKTKYSAVAAKFGDDLKIAAMMIESGKIPDIGYRLPQDGIIVDERSYRAELNRARTEAGLAPLEYPDDLGGTVDGVITDEASYQAELNRSKQLDGMA